MLLNDQSILGTDSTAAGYLLPQTDVADDDELLDLYQPIVQAISGLGDGSFVRPSWQSPDEPNEPPINTDWIALRVSHMRDDTFMTEIHVDTDGLGYDLVEYTEDIDLILSCYGPHSQGYARVLKDGFRLEQNRAQLQAMNTDVLEASQPVTLPALVTGKWRRRVDVTINMRRRVSRKYNIRSIVQAVVTVNTEQFVDPVMAPLEIPT